MREFHVFSAKRLGWETMYDYIPFPVEKFSKDEAEKQFIAVKKCTTKNNGESYPYTAYEYDNTTYYSILYLGIKTEEEYNRL